MDPLDPNFQPEPPAVPQDPTFISIVNRLTQFYKTQLPEDPTGMAIKANAESVAQDVMLECITMFERFTQNRSAIAKYDLLKWLGNKRQEVRLYK